MWMIQLVFLIIQLDEEVGPVDCTWVGEGVRRVRTTRTGLCTCGGFLIFVRSIYIHRVSIFLVVSFLVVLPITNLMCKAYHSCSVNGHFSHLPQPLARPGHGDAGVVCPKREREASVDCQ